MNNCAKCCLCASLWGGSVQDTKTPPITLCFSSILSIWCLISATMPHLIYTFYCFQQNQLSLPMCAWYVRGSDGKKWPFAATWFHHDDVYCVVSGSCQDRQAISICGNFKPKMAPTPKLSVPNKAEHTYLSRCSTLWPKRLHFDGIIPHFFGHFTSCSNSIIWPLIYAQH